MFKTTALNSVANEYVDKDDGTSTPGTRIEADDQNIVMDELVNAVEGAGITLDPTGVLRSQLLTAIISRGYEPNLLINPEMLVNQRVFAGGALTAGDYGFDRWKASVGDANMSVTAAGVVTLASGGIEQIIENPGLASRRTVISAIMTSGTLSYDVEGETGSLTGTGLQTDVIDIPGGSTGNITFKLSVSGSTVFKNLKFETDNYTPFVRNFIDKESVSCQRYYSKSYNQSVAPGTATSDGRSVSETWNVNSSDHTALLSTRFPQLMRTGPTVILYDLAGNSGKVTMAVGDNIAGTVQDESDSGFTGLGTNGAVDVDRKLSYHYEADAEL
jgi:hypothetical protein